MLEIDDRTEDEIYLGSNPPGGHPADGRREDSGRSGRVPLSQARPGSHFASTSIIKKDEMERMDEIGTQEGGWASTNDSIDYNKKINFSDDEDGNRESGRRPVSNRNEMRDTVLSEEGWDRGGGKVDKQQSINERERDQPPRFESNRSSRDQYEHDNEDDGNKKRVYDKERDRDRGGRRPREDDWRRFVLIHLLYNRMDLI